MNRFEDELQYITYQLQLMNKEKDKEKELYKYLVNKRTILLNALVKEWKRYIFKTK